MLADVVAAGDHLEVIIDPADAQAAPVPRPDVRRMQVPIGPVAVFGASNFPLAFSTAGGDTGSALAAGCPVVVKGHPAHPRTGSLVASLISEAVTEAGLPEGTFGHVLESGFGLAQRLVGDDRIEAVAFTGSLRGGQAISGHAAARPRPIPVYAEMGSLNPVIVTEAALLARAAEIADGLAASVSTFGGQLCTKPGIALFPAGEAGEAFCELVGERLAAAAPQVLLTKAIADGFAAGLAEVDAAPGVTRLGAGSGSGGAAAGGGDGNVPFAAGVPTAYRAEAGALSADALREEHFGPAVILVAYADRDELIDALSSLGGQLAISIHSEAADTEWVQGVLPQCVAQAGRIVFDGFSTGRIGVLGDDARRPVPRELQRGGDVGGDDGDRALPAARRLPERARGAAAAGAGRRQPARGLPPRGRGRVRAAVIRYRASAPGSGRRPSRPPSSSARWCSRPG